MGFLFAELTFDRDALGRRLIRATSVAVVLFALAYGAFVLTALGQRWDDVLMLHHSSPESRRFAQEQLGNITKVTLAGLILLLAGIGAARRRYALGLAAAGTVAVSVLLTEGFKRLLPRPELAEVSAKLVGNSFPSGHTTIAMSAMFGLVIVVPYRARPWAALFGLAWAVGFGAYTVVADWHRPSDTFGGDLVAFAVACSAAAVPVLRGEARHVAAQQWGRLLAVGIPLGFVVVSGLLSGAGPGLAGAASALTALVFLALLYRVDLAPAELSTPNEYFSSGPEPPEERTIAA